MSILRAIVDKPAMKNLVKAFNRWQKEEPCYRDGTHAEILTQRVLASVGMEPQDQAPLLDPAGVAFITSLPLLLATSIPLVDRICEICTQPYRNLAEEGNACVATRLPCNHIFCSRCINTWMHPMEGGNNSCPYCRREFFPKLPDLDTVEGLQARIDFFDWRAQSMGCVAQPEQRRMIQGWTKTIISDRLEEARRECEIESQAVMRLLEDQGVSDAELSGPLTAKSPRPLLELHLWEALIDAIYFLPHISIQLDQGSEERENE